MMLYTAPLPADGSAMVMIAVSPLSAILGFHCANTADNTSFLWYVEGMQDILKAVRLGARSLVTPEKLKILVSVSSWAGRENSNTGTA